MMMVLLKAERHVFLNKTITHAPIARAGSLRLVSNTKALCLQTYTLHDSLAAAGPRRQK